MPNSLSVRVVEDGYRNAVVHLVGVVEDADINQAPAIALNQFTGNDRGTFNGFKVVDVDYSVTDGLTVVLAWNANTPQPICALASAGEIRGRGHGGIVPDRTAGGYDGAINLTTKGFTPGRSYGFTVKLRMKKSYS